MKWLHIEHVMQRLKCKQSRQEMIRRLRDGIEIRIGKNARIYTHITRKEAQELVALRPLRKLQVLAAAARATKDWEDEWNLPTPMHPDDRHLMAPRIRRWWDG